VRDDLGNVGLNDAGAMDRVGADSVEVTRDLLQRF
jgi:hypothetical protein